MRQFLSSVLCIGLLLASITQVSAFYTGMPASIVIGQNDFVSNSVNQGTSSAAANFLSTPTDSLVIDSKLIVVDRGNNRVLIYNSIPTTNNVSADLVIGQPDLLSNNPNQNQGAGLTPGANTLRFPAGIATDGIKLFIADLGNNRILIFNKLPTSNNANADIVIGQSAMNTRSSGTSSTTTNQPFGVFYDRPTGKLFFSDLNNRVLIYNSIPTSNGAAADMVLGQVDFDHGSANQGGSANSTTMRSPGGVWVDSGKLFVTDEQNNRVLIWNSIPRTNAAPADVVVGQNNFTSVSVNQGGSAGVNTMNFPIDVLVDKNRMYVSEFNNNRILIYNSIPTTNGASADMVIGQTDFSGSSANQGASTSISSGFKNQAFLRIENNKLIVGDFNNNRILIFNNVLSTPLMSINPPTSQPEGKIRIQGNISLGERPNYSMQKVTAVINGGNENNVTYLDGGRDNGPGNTLYEFYNDFNPTIRGGSASDYTINFRAQSFNADEDKYFYFTPFSLDKVTVESMPTFTFTVNQTFRDQLKNNLVKYQIWTKKDKEKDWKLYIDNILTSQENYGKIVVKGKTKLLPGKYQVQVKAINIMNHEQQSNNLNINIKLTRK